MSGSTDAPPPGRITEALHALSAGVPEAMDRLMPLVYDQLRGIAHRQLRKEQAGHTLSTTGLVHEAFLKLDDQTRVQWTDRGQFFALASRVMRRVLVDYARRHGAAMRGGPHQRALSLEVLEQGDPSGRSALLDATRRADALLVLDQALDRLSGVSHRLAQVVECRFFGGLSEAETAEALGVSKRTVARDWLTARGWLYQELRDETA